MNAVAVERLVYSTRETAELLGKSEKAIRRLVALGHLPGIKLGRTILVRADDIEAIFYSGRLAPVQKQVAGKGLTENMIPRLKPGIYGDGNGLYLRVKQSGARSFVLRVQYDGKREDIGLGGYPADLTLAEAREKAAWLRKAARQGDDAIAMRDEGKKKRGRPRKLRWKPVDQMPADRMDGRALKLRTPRIITGRWFFSGWENGQCVGGRWINDEGRDIAKATHWADVEGPGL